MIGVIGVVISLLLLIYLAYKGWSVILIAPVLALVAALFVLFEGGSFHIMAIYTETFMPNLAAYVKANFPVFLLGAVFGKVMDLSGCAKAIAEFIVKKSGTGKEIIAVVLACAVITYGGVSLFVAAFAIYPIGAALFRASDVPKRLLPPAIALGAFTFTMTALPGTPQIQNAIPMRYFGTDAFAAPVLGIIAALIELILGLLWLQSRLKKAKEKGEGYGDHPNEQLAVIDESKLPPFWISIAPIILVIVANLLCSKWILPSMNHSYLETDFGTEYSAVGGTWSLIIGLVLGIGLAIALNVKRFENGIPEALKAGANNSLLAILNTASEVGYGNVIKTLPAYLLLATGLLGISSNPLIGEAIASSVMAGVTGSASGGLSIALENFAPQFMEMADSAGISYEALHRIAAVACGGLDTLPHNGAVITLLMATSMTHKESYMNIGMCTVVVPTIATIAIIILATFGVC